MLLRCTILFCLISTTVNAQQVGQHQINNRTELASALVSLCGADLSCSANLLGAHKDLVNVDLWRDLMTLADSHAISPPTAYSLALQVASTLNDKRLSGITYYKTGWYEFGEGKISDAVNNYLRSKELFEQAGARHDLIYVLADLGTLYIYSADYEGAREFSESSLALAEQVKTSDAPAGQWPDQYGVGTALANLGNIVKRNGEYEKAILHFQKSLATFETIENDRQKYTFKIIDDLWDIGQTYVDEGDYLHGLEYLTKSIRLAKESRETARSAGISSSLGILYLNQRDYLKAVDFFQQALQLAVTANDQFKQADILLNLGVSYQFERAYAPALENFQRALEIAKRINYSELLIPIQEGLGVVYKEQGKYKEALDALDSAFEAATRTQNKTRVAEVLLRRSEVQLAKDDLSKAIENGNEAVKLAEQLSLRNVRYLALTVLGKAYRAGGQNDLALQTFATATTHIEQMRNQVAGLENDRQLFFEDKVTPYREMIEISLATKKPDSNERALLIAESAKARVLFDVLSTGRVDLTKAMSEQEKTEEKRLNKRIVDLNLEIAEQTSKRNADSAQVKDLEQQLRSARIQYETFQDSLVAAHPELRARANSLSASFGEISEIVSDNKTAVLEYVFTGSKTYLLVLTKPQGSESPKLEAHPLSVSVDDVAKRVSQFRDMITTQSAFADSARELYDLLVKPAEEQLRGKTTLCIVPDGPLWDLPFQALKPTDSRYLLEDFAISYAPSLSVLREMAKRKRDNSATSLLAFGNPTVPREIAANVKAAYRDESLGPLPEAETEVGALRSIWGPSLTRVLIGANASKDVFRSEAAKYKIIHFATHGILDDTSPMYSRLVMARDQNDPNDDGLLEAREIMRLNLHADLVVLSACQTARGRFGAGEGMIGMSWAFFIAGVPTMVASQWKVDSASTAALMIDFHKRLKEQAAKPSATKAGALQQAALALMKDPRYRHPFFWAGFVMIGTAETKPAR